MRNNKITDLVRLGQTELNGLEGLYVEDNQCTTLNGLEGSATFKVSKYDRSSVKNRRIIVVTLTLRSLRNLKPFGHNQ